MVINPRFYSNFIALHMNCEERKMVRFYHILAYCREPWAITIRSQMQGTKLKF